MNCNRLMSKVSSCFMVFVLILLCSNILTFAGTGALDGKTFSGEVGKKGDTSGMKDDLMFKEGKFRSTACDVYGFGDANYTVVTAAAAGEATTFQAETHSPTDGTMKWVGTIKGNMLEGNTTWIREGKEPEEHWVKASLKQ